MRWTVLALVIGGSFVGGYYARDVIDRPAFAEPKQPARGAGGDKLVRLPDGRVVRVLPDGTTQAVSETDGLSLEKAQLWTAMQTLHKNSTAVLGSFGCENPEKLAAPLRPLTTDSQELMNQKIEAMRALTVAVTICSGRFKLDTRRKTGPKP
jgi:hypothetical protein